MNKYVRVSCDNAIHTPSAKKFNIKPALKYKDFYNCALLIESDGKPCLCYIMMRGHNESAMIEEGYLRGLRLKPLEGMEVEIIKEALYGGDLYMSEDGCLAMNRALTQAASEGNRDEVVRWLNMGVNPRMDNNGPVMAAVRGGHADILKLLITYGWNPV
jgi:hypothetical protein